MMNEKGHYAFVDKKKTGVYSHTNFYSDNKYNVMIVILSPFSLFLLLRFAQSKEKGKKRENKPVWLSRNLYEIGSKKKTLKSVEEI